MKRSMTAFFIGALLLTSGHVALTVGVHPQHVASVRALIAAVLGVVLGTAVLGLGMTGMADAYERVAGRVQALLGTKAIDPDCDLIVAPATGLEPHNRGFWRAYAIMAVAVCVFMAGVLALDIALTEYTFLFNVVAMAAGLGVLVPLTLYLAIRSLLRVHHIHGGVAASAETLAAMPDRSEQPRSRPARPRWQPRLTHTPRYTRSLAQRGRAGS